MDFLSSVLKDTKNEFASRASDGIAAGDVETFVDTGSYIFNALVSGSILEVFLPTKSLPWQENQARERLSLPLCRSLFP